MKRILLVLLIACAGCVTEVEYDITCDWVECPNADETSSFNGGTLNSFNCIWLCADYQGNESVYVSLTFEVGYDGCWALAYEYISDGICSTPGVY